MANTIRLTCNTVKAGEKNHNGRTYSTAVMQKMVDFVNAKAKDRTLFGELEKGIFARSSVSIVDATHMLNPDFTLTNGLISGSITLIENPCGGLIRESLTRGDLWTLTPRGFGSCGEDGIIGDDYELITFDVYLPE